MNQRLSDLLNTPYYLCEKDFNERVRIIQEKYTIKKEPITGYKLKHFAYCENFLQIIPINKPTKQPKRKEFKEKMTVNIEINPLIVGAFYPYFYSIFETFFLRTFEHAGAEVLSKVLPFHEKTFFSGIWVDKMQFNAQEWDPILNELEKRLITILEKKFKTKEFGQDWATITNQCFEEIRNSRSLVPLINIMHFFSNSKVAYNVGL